MAISRAPKDTDINGDTPAPEGQRKKVVVVGLGMVGIAFVSVPLDAFKKGEPGGRSTDLVCTARNYSNSMPNEENTRLWSSAKNLTWHTTGFGLTSYFQHREVKSLYLNPEKWYKDHPDTLDYHLNTLVAEIKPQDKIVITAKGDTISYDILVIATGSDALLPRHTPGHDAKGVFVYRTIEDLENLIIFSATVKGTTGCVVGGGLLGLEAAKAMMDLEEFDQVKLIERNRWVLSRQLDADAGNMVVELVRELGLDVMVSKRVGKILTNDANAVRGVVFEDGEEMECSCIMFAIGIKARDELARKAGLKCADRGGGITIDNDLRTSDP